MTLKDCIRPLDSIKTEKWQLGSLVANSLKNGGVAFIFVPDYRGANGTVEKLDFSVFRKFLYELSRQDFNLPIVELGELIVGKTLADTYYILQEVVATCIKKGVLPIVIGGSDDLSYPLFSAVNHLKTHISYTQISHTIAIKNIDDDKITEQNYVAKILDNPNFNIKELNILGYQKHLNSLHTVSLMNEMSVNTLRLAELMNSTEKSEPFFRTADLVTLNCDAIESFSAPLSVHPQVNGLNRREICAYMREIGLGQNLKTLGIFNFNFSLPNDLNMQLLAQMLWYFLEGLHIQRTHPKQRNYETFMVMFGNENFIFKRDVFSNQWYFGTDENIKNCIPCTREDYENAKIGILNKRLK